MKLKKAIKKAKKHKTKIKNKNLNQYMRNQTAKSLIHWLLYDPKSNMESFKILAEWLDSDGWELEK
jgi:hypothetical protein